ncbi:MAG: glycosyltransferase [Sulfuritalea sp.]|nr:glycosyltransferase [Sulfuritalea sp.]
MTAAGLSVLHFSTADIIGGSARSAYRIHSGLRARGHRSHMLVGYRASNDPDVATVSGHRCLQFADRAVDKLSGKVGAQYLWLPSSHRVVRHPWLKEANVIQLYNTHGGYFSQWLLPRLAMGASLVWRLSDQWAMTGHCAYSGDCQRWLDGCGQCPALETYPSIGRDTTAALFRRKLNFYRQTPMTIVAPSSWIRDLAAQSPLLGRYPIVHIPNGLDGSMFYPRDRLAARAALDLPPDAKVILFSAHILDNNPRKGGDLLKTALNRIPLPPGTVLMLMGEGGESWSGRVPCAIKRVGFRAEPEAMAICYAAADIVVVPSVLENLPNTLVESLACGRAVVAVDSGGMRDGVRHGETGYLARTGDVDDLAAGILLLLGDDRLRANMEAAANCLFLEEFTLELELQRMEELYLDIRPSRDLQVEDGHR